MTEPGMKTIWYFVGLILIVMGGIIFLTGIYQYFNPPEIKKVLAYTHPNLWWGAFMVVFGGIIYWKSRKQSR